MTTAKQSKSDQKTYARHQAKGGVYLTVADGTPEFNVALKYAGLMAKGNKCKVGVLSVLEMQDFQHWGKVEERMRDEQKAAADIAFGEASLLLEQNGLCAPLHFVEEGGRREAVLNVIEENPEITMLVLGGNTQGSNPGPLVSHFTGKGMPKLRVPVLVVPDHLDSGA